MVTPGHYTLSCRLSGYSSLEPTQPSVEVYLATQREMKLPPFVMEKVVSSQTTYPSSDASSVVSPREWCMTKQAPSTNPIRSVRTSDFQIVPPRWFQDKGYGLNLKSEVRLDAQEPLSLNLKPSQGWP